MYTTFIAFTIEENLFKCILSIKKSIHKFSLEDNGGYIVYLTLAPLTLGKSALEATCKIE